MKKRIVQVLSLLLAAMLLLPCVPPASAADGESGEVMDTLVTLGLLPGVSGEDELAARYRAIVLELFGYGEDAAAFAPAAGVEASITLDAVRAVRFVDVPADDRFCDAASYAAYLHLLTGDEAGYFHPDLIITRGQTVDVLHRLAKALGKTGAGSGDAMGWAVESGILIGNGGGSYQESAPVTRAQMAVFLYRFAQYAGFDTGHGDATRYPDDGAVPDYARDAVVWAFEHDVLPVFAQDRVNPELALTRAQTAGLMTALIADALEEPVAAEIAKPLVSPPLESVSRAEHEQIQEYIDSVAQKYGAVGLQVAVIENGHVTDSYAYGWATKNSARMTADHKMRIASISKVVLGMDAMRMREDGLIDLDSPIGTYWGANFKNPYYPDTPVNIRSILTHTSSMPMLEASAAYTYATVKQRQQGSSGYSHVVPGSIYSWGYNNYAFGVLGMTLELAADKNVDTMLHEYFFDAMQIDGSFYAGDVRDTSLLVTLCGPGGSVQRSVSTQKDMHAGKPGSSGSVFAGGLTISAKDLAKMIAVLASDGEYEGLRMLSRDSVATMETLSAKTVSDGFYQGMPLRYRTSIYGRDALYFHTGSAYGVYNCMSYDPATGDGVVVLSVGASATKDQYGIYAVCGSIQDYIYKEGSSHKITVR